MSLIPKDLIYGLLYEIYNEANQISESIPIPLTSVDVKASFVHAVAQVEITQVYVNKENHPIEAIYYFPVNPDGAVNLFEVELEGKVLKGEVQDAETAQKAYEQAVGKGETAFLGEETKADILKIQVGCLKPGAQAKVVIGYVTEVKNEPGSNSIRFYIPTTIAPRYVSPSENGNKKAQEIAAMEYSEDSPAPISIKVSVSLQGGIKSIQSPTHDIKVGECKPIPENQIWHKALVELDGHTTDMDRDFVLKILPEEPHKPRLYSEKREDGSTAMMIHLVPSFKLVVEQKTELIFVIDRSGSMEGESIKLARMALVLFLHSLPTDCYFNIVGFGSSYKFLTPKSAKYGDDSLKRAITYSDSMGGDFGGTEILSPLRAIFDMPNIDGYGRQVFVLTDGEVSNAEAVLGLTKANAHKCRVFSLGIGQSASHELVEGIARAGGGTSAFVAYDISICWEGQGNDKEQEVNKEKTLLGYNKPINSQTEDSKESICLKQSPSMIPPMFDGSQLLVLACFKNEKLPTAVTITAQSPDGPLSLRIEYKTENDLTIGCGRILHCLAAAKVVRELELEQDSQSPYSFDEERWNEEKRKIIEIGCKYGITSRYTSFFVANSNENSKYQPSQMNRRVVPSQICSGYGAYDDLFQCRSMSLSVTKRQKMSKSFFPVFEMLGTFLDKFSRQKAPHNAPAARGYVQPKHLSRSTGPPEQEPDHLKLTRFQSYDGSYKLDENLGVILKLDLTKLQDGVEREKLDETVFATALVICYFEKKMQEKKESWELIVLKARKWMKKVVGEDEVEKVNEIVAFYL